ncbi:MAG: hypothetical protein ACKVH8_06535 [Pirellulales bacterium]
MNVQFTCPDCATTINLNPTKLIQGGSFSCSNCDLAVSLAQESLSVAEETLFEFQKLVEQQSPKTALA